MIYPILFVVGGTGYCLLEIIWRGYTHWSMALAGALSLVFMGYLCLNFKELPVFFKAFLSSLFITGTELIFGIIFNLYFNMDVWNYSNRPFNFAGQICPQFSLLWFFLSYGVIFTLEKVFLTL